MFEAKKSHLESKNNTAKGFPVLPFASQVSTMMLKGIIYVPEASKYKKDPILASVITHYNSVSAVYMPIKYKNINGDEDIAGFMCIEYKHPTNFTEIELGVLKRHKLHVSYMITESKVQ